MKVYAVHLRETGELVVWGGAETCAGVLGMKRRTFWQTVADCRRGRNGRYAVQVFGKMDPMECPCLSCPKSPPGRPEWAVSWSCDTPGKCDLGWGVWLLMYWEALRERVHGRSAGGGRGK